MSGPRFDTDAKANPGPLAGVTLQSPLAVTLVICVFFFPSSSVLPVSAYLSQPALLGSLALRRYDIVLILLRVSRSSGRTACSVWRGARSWNRRVRLLVRPGQVVTAVAWCVSTVHPELRLSLRSRRPGDLGPARPKPRYPTALCTGATEDSEGGTPPQCKSPPLFPLRG